MQNLLKKIVNLNNIGLVLLGISLVANYKLIKAKNSLDSALYQQQFNNKLLKNKLDLEVRINKDIQLAEQQKHTHYQMLIQNVNYMCESSKNLYKYQQLKDQNTIIILQSELKECIELILGQKKI